MPSLSVSFTLGKASVPNSANVSHNNREFVADNVDANRSCDNITFMKQDIREAYDELFGEAVREHNKEKKKPCRRINDYYERIKNGKREEAFYEIIVQFGDSVNAPVGSESGKAVQKMLCEYMEEFKSRNPNLHVFNAVLHMDEASPHLHIDVIPFYTEPKKRGLSKGVSMKSALIEQGFVPKGKKQNHLVMWENSELKAMEKILNRHNFSRDRKGATYKHMTVEEYKSFKSEEKLTPTKVSSQKWRVTDDVEVIQRENHLLKREKEKLKEKIHSPYKSFYYSSSEKQLFVQSKMDEMGIPYRETENGFEAQECYVDDIRKIEKQFSPREDSFRSKLRSDIDKFCMQSKTFDEVLLRLKKAGYEIKEGKYLAVKPKFSGRFIRLKSLGEDYSEQALKNRMVNKQRFENDINQKTMAYEKENPDAPITMSYKTIRHYTVVFSSGALPMNKRNKHKPFSWTNDKELDKLAQLNEKINSGVSVASLRNEFISLEKTITEKVEAVERLKSETKFFAELYSKARLCFGENPLPTIKEREKMHSAF